MSVLGPVLLAEDKSLNIEAEILAKELGLLFGGSFEDLRNQLKIAKDNQNKKYFLVLERNGIYLRQGMSCRRKPIFSDFLKWSADLKKTNLTRTMKGVSKDSLIIDATAGLGRDSLVLASLSSNVTLLERVPWIHALLMDGLSKSKKQNALLSKMHPICVDSRTYLLGLKHKVNVIYLDPMFSRSDKSKAKKEIQALRELTEFEENENLLDISLKTAEERVIVKRHRNSRYLEGFKPTFSLFGRVVRYDVYSLKLN